MTDFLKGLRERAKPLQCRIAFPEASDPRTAAAVEVLTRDGIVQPVLVGVQNGNADLECIDPATHDQREALLSRFVQRRAHKGLTEEFARELLDQPLIYAALMVDAGLIDGMVGGAACPTGDVIRAGVWCIGPADGIQTISSAFYMVVPPFRSSDAEVITFADAGVIPEPTIEQLADIAVAACEDRRSIVGDEPRVAFLSYSTHGSAGGARVERMQAAFKLFKARAPHIVADGEMQADAALIADVAARKTPDSPVGGSANVLIFPDLDSGNIAYKLVQRLAQADAVGPILQGLAKPCNDLSRGASVQDIVSVACVTALQVRSAPNLPKRDATS